MSKPVISIDQCRTEGMNKVAGVEKATVEFNSKLAKIGSKEHFKVRLQQVGLRDRYAWKYQNKFTKNAPIRFEDADHVDVYVEGSK